MSKAMEKKAALSAGADRTGVLILGMHRSGTSALSRVLSLLGCDLPKTLMGGGETNETGHWESTEVMRLNDEILASAGSLWNDWLPFNPGWYSSPKAAEFKEKALGVLAEEFGESRLFVLKDPRICRIAPFWLEVLETAGVRPAIVMPVRNPLEVADSLRTRNGFDPALGHLLWLRHVLEAEAATRGMPRFHSSYDGLLESWPRLVSGMQETLGVSWPRLSPLVAEEVDAFLTARLRHHRESPKSVSDNPLLSAWLRESYAIFMRWAEEGESAADHEALDRIRAEFDAAAPAFSRLISAGQQAARKVKSLDGSLKDAQAKLGAAEAAATEQDKRAQTLEQELQSATARMQEQQARFDSLRAEHQALAQGKAASDRDLEEARTALAASQATVEDKQRELAEAAERLDSARVELAGAQSEVETLRTELEDMRGQLSHTQSALAQRSAEADDAATQLQEAEQRLADELKAERARVAERFEEIASLSRMLSEKEHEIAAAQARSRAEEEAARRRLDEAERAGRLAEELEIERARLAERFDEIAALTRMLREKEEEASVALEHSRAEKDAAERRAAEAEDARRQESARAERLASDLETERSRAKAEAQRLRSEKGAVESRLSERFGEIAVMTRLLGEKEKEAERAEWLREVSAVLLNGFGSNTVKGRLLSLLPAPIRLAKQQKMLKSKGIFDADAYLAAYPDVAKAGLDPLTHYIRHGLSEGRQLPMRRAPGGTAQNYEKG